MFPLVIAGLVWGYNAVKIAQLSDRNRLKKRDSDEEKNLTVFNNCTFEDKRTYNNYDNCTFNTYIIRRGGNDERE